METMVDRLWYIEEPENHVKNVVKRYYGKKYVAGVLTGVLFAKNIINIKKRVLYYPFFNVLPGIELFSQGATPQISSPLTRFTTEFEMDRSGSTSP